MKWGSAPLIVKFLLISGALASNIHCLIFGFQSSRCFRDYAITDTVANALDGNALNIVKGTFGWGVIGLVGYNMLTYSLIGSWASAMLAKHSKISSDIGEDVAHVNDNKVLAATEGEENVKLTQILPANSSSSVTPSKVQNSNASVELTRVKIVYTTELYIKYKYMDIYI